MSSWESQYATGWPSGLRRWLQAPVRKGRGFEPHSSHPLINMAIEQIFACGATAALGTYAALFIVCLVHVFSKGAIPR